MGEPGFAADFLAEAVEVIGEGFEAEDLVDDNLAFSGLHPVELGHEEFWFIEVTGIAVAVNAADPIGKGDGVGGEAGFIGDEAVVVVGDDFVPGVAHDGEADPAVPARTAELEDFIACGVVAEGDVEGFGDAGAGGFVDMNEDVAGGAEIPPCPVGAEQGIREGHGGEEGLAAQDPVEDEGGDDGGVAFDDVFGGGGGEFAPGDFFVGNSAGVAAVAGGGVADLAEIAPEGDAGAFEVLVEHGHDADGEVAGDAATDLEEADGAFAVFEEFGGSGIPLGEGGHVFNAGANGVDVFNVSADHGGGKHVAQGGVFPAWHDDGEVFLAGGDKPGVGGVDLVALFENARTDEFIHELVGEEAFSGAVGGSPFGKDGFFDTAHGLHLWDAGVGDAVHVAVEELLFVGGGEIAVVGNAFVEVVSDEVKDILFEVRSGADDGVDFILADHFCQAEAEFGGGHGAGEGDEHFTAGFEMGFVALGSVEKGGGVKVAIVEGDELGDGAFLFGEGGVEVFWSLGLAFGFHGLSD